VIDLMTEAPIPLAAAAAIIPPGRNGRRTHLSTLLRWVLTGARGPDGSRVRLEAVRLGGRWMTTRAALQRFTERLTPRMGGAESTPAPRTSGKRLRASERAGAELERLGI
jgi:hypothetical protein